MAVITIPDNLSCDAFSWGQSRNTINFKSPFGTQSVDVRSPWWTATLSAPVGYEKDSGVWQKLLLQLRGSTNQLAMHNLARPVPLGTMRGSMSTYFFNYAVGTSNISIVASGQSGKTLVVGDFLGVGSGTTQQVVEVISNSTADGSGIINVDFEPPLRNAFTAGTPITWDKPKVLFRQQESNSSWDYNSTMSSGYKMSLLEDPRP
jgi:hypothetical protein